MNYQIKLTREIEYVRTISEEEYAHLMRRTGLTKAELDAAETDRERGEIIADVLSDSTVYSWHWMTDSQIAVVTSNELDVSETDAPTDSERRANYEVRENGMPY